MRAVLDPAALRPAAFVALGAGLARPLLPDGAGVPCPLRQLTGVPCPLCGMTTSVTDVLHLDIAGAVTASPGGVLVAVLAVLAALSAWRRPVVLPSWAVVLGLAGLWVWQLQRFALL